MTLGSILLATALLLLVGIVIARPLLAPVHRVAAQGKRDQLLAEKEALLIDIRALEFDFETGKLPATEYETERAQLVNNAANVLRQLDDLPEDEDSAETQIEAAIAALRQQAAASWVCQKCQTQNPVENGFCGQCGEAQA